MAFTCWVITEGSVRISAITCFGVISSLIVTNRSVQGLACASALSTVDMGWLNWSLWISVPGVVKVSQSKSSRPNLLASLGTSLVFCLSSLYPAIQAPLVCDRECGCAHPVVAGEADAKSCVLTVGCADAAGSFCVGGGPASEDGTLLFTDTMR